MFRCAYCLKREQWGQVTREFDIDHFVAQAARPGLVASYDNLIYSCARCNSIKLDKSVPGPVSSLTVDQVRLLPHGRLQGITPLATSSILRLALNSPRLVEWRSTWIRIIQLAEERDPHLHRQLMKFPDDLPDLAKLRPPSNARPDGREESFFEKRKRGQLPTIY